MPSDNDASRQNEVRGSGTSPSFFRPEVISSAQHPYSRTLIAAGELRMTLFAPVTALTALMLAVSALMFTMADDAAPTSSLMTREKTVQILRPLTTLVGDWKGVGQPKRGSNVGAWSEKATAAWKFDGDSAGLILTFETGKQFHSATFSVADDGQTPQLMLTPLMGESVLLTRIKSGDDSKPSDEAWIFESTTGTGPQTRCTIRIISDIRITLLFEEKLTDKASARRLAEIGLTRAGAKLASGNAGERQCIVTGGLGTIKVSHEGKTYYVCCEGCKQAFDADPEGTLKSYRERLNQTR